MEEIQQKAIETYTKNLEYLQQNHNDLFNRINALSSFIDSGDYTERYHLEYIQEENAFDLYDTKTQTFVYNKQPNKFDKEAVKSSGFNRLNTFDLFDKITYNKNIFDDISQGTDDYNKSLIYITNHILEYQNIFNKKTYQEKEFKYFYKFIFIGTLLGTHILKVAKKINAPLFFICEANLEIFRLSLFVTPYYSIQKNSQIVFSIMEDELQLIDRLSKFFITNPKETHILKYYSTNYNISNYFEKIIEVILSKSPLQFNYGRVFEQLYKKSLQNIQKYPTLNTIKRYNLLHNIPVLILGAGPSLQKNIKWLQNNHKFYFTVAIGAATVKLLENDIKPNLITSVDTGVDVLHHFPDKIKNSLQHIALLASHMTDQAILNQFNQENIFLFEVMTQFKKTSDLLEGYSIGEASVNLGLILGANHIYLLGMDLALDQETGASHIGEHQYLKTHDIKDQEYNSFMNENSYDAKDTKLIVRGNFQEKVTTTTVFNKSIVAFQIILEKFTNREIYNLSDGAYLPHTIPLNIDKITIDKSFDPLNIEINSFLSSHSKSSFSNEDMLVFKNSFKIIQKILTELDSIEKINVKTYDQFSQLRTNIFHNAIQGLKEYKSTYINEVFINYILIIEPYLAYQFNDKDVKEANCIKKVKKVWIKQIRELCNRYIDIVEHSIQGI